MIYNYVTKIRGKISLFAKNKTTNIFDGSYKSVFQGNGMDFENLREYIQGDNIKDIDWKATSRSGKVLVKRYIAEKKHNIMLVFDTGKKMSAFTDALEEKKELALNAGGTIGYLAAINGNNVGAVFNQAGMIQYHPLRTGLMNIERILTMYDREKLSDYNASLEKSIQYLVKYINRRMIVFIITDDMGIRDISEDSLKKLTYQHDVLFINISDARIGDKDAYSVEKGVYMPEFIASNENLKQLEEQTKAKLQEDNEDKLNRYRIVSTKIGSYKELVDRITELLGGHKYANSR